MDLSKVVGDDPLPYGVEASRKTLDAFMQMNLDQKIISEAMTTDEVFAW
jgi:4,5-dihydroxyphthalate decarboxylase